MKLAGQLSIAQLKKTLEERRRRREDEEQLDKGIDAVCQRFREERRRRI